MRSKACGLDLLKDPRVKPPNALTQFESRLGGLDSLWVKAWGP